MIAPRSDVSTLPGRARPDGTKRRACAQNMESAIMAPVSRVDKNVQEEDFNE
jgi:hypothetical protein